MRVYVEICGEQFNKKKFSERWKGIVNGYELGVSLSPGDTAFMTETLSRVSRFAKIMARGRVGFKVVNQVFNGKKVRGVVMTTPNSNHEVWVGKGAVISAIFPRTTVPNLAKENRRNVIRALRGVIEPQIQQYRRRYAGQSVIKSSLTGKPILGPYHVDHVYPFIRLVEEWCRENGLDLETIEVKCKGTVCRLASVDLAESWFDYHALHAEYQVLDAAENVSKGAKYLGRGRGE